MPEPESLDGRLERQLRHEVRSAAVGERIPSIRSLRNKYSVGQTAVERALSRLAQEGLLEVRPKSGVYRCAPAPSPVTLIYRRSESPESGTYYGDFVAGLIVELAKAGHPVRLHRTASDAAFGDILRHLARTRELAVTFALKRSDTELIARHQDRVPDFFHVLPNIVEPVDRSVYLDDRAIVRLQIDHLVQRGHRRVGYLHRHRDDVWSRPDAERLHAFRAAAVDHGLPLRPADVAWVGDAGEHLARGVADMMAQDDPPTALVLCGDSYVNPAYAALRAANRTPGRDVAVVSVNNRPWCDFTAPPLTSVDVSPQRGAAVLAGMLQRQKDGETVGREVLPAELRVRASSDFDAAG